ncbi:MAG TPA: hypothetical protein VN131_00425 [Mobilitalea sp.]|nr:hypothetical protein [Mobilitalea sp.]
MMNVMSKDSVIAVNVAAVSSKEVTVTDKTVQTGTTVSTDNTAADETAVAAGENVTTVDETTVGTDEAATTTGETTATSDQTATGMDETAATTEVTTVDASGEKEFMAKETMVGSGGVAVDPGMSQGMPTDPSMVTGMVEVKDPLLSSWPVVIGISGAVLFVSIVLGALLARRKIKKGIELYED